MTSRPGQHTITTHILPNILQSKGNQVMKFGQVIVYSKRNIFLQKSCIKWGRETNCVPTFVFSKSFIWGNTKWSAA